MRGIPVADGIVSIIFIGISSAVGVGYARKLVEAVVGERMQARKVNERIPDPDGIIVIVEYVDGIAAEIMLEIGQLSGGVEGKI